MSAGGANASVPASSVSFCAEGCSLLSSGVGCRGGVDKLILPGTRRGSTGVTTVGMIGSRVMGEGVDVNWADSGCLGDACWGY